MSPASLGLYCCKYCRIVVKGTLSPKFFPPYMKDITLLNIIHNVKFLFSHPFNAKIADVAKNVRLKGPEKQAIVFCGGPKRKTMSLL